MNGPAALSQNAEVIDRLVDVKNFENEQDVFVNEKPHDGNVRPNESHP